MSRTIAAVILTASVLSACVQSRSPAPTAECMVPAAAWCDANYRCDGDRAQLARCMSAAQDACSTWQASDADAAQCADLQDDLACDGASLVNDPESASCLREFWRF